MTFFEKAKDKAEQLIGDAEEKVGQMLGHEDPENTKKHDPWTGEVKEAGHDLRDDTTASAVDQDTTASAVDQDTTASAVDQDTTASAVDQDTTAGAVDDAKGHV